MLTHHTCHTGHIPVRTGEPALFGVLIPYLRAYPRLHGGTQVALGAACPTLGLSPLTRGNLNNGCAAFIQVGPIPAHAGEPVGNGVEIFIVKAYPRSRGGT